LPQPLTIPDVMTIKTLADVHTPIGYLPVNRKAGSTCAMSLLQIEAAVAGTEVGFDRRAYACTIHLVGAFGFACRRGRTTRLYRGG
jgi:hypothetical protein